MHIGKYLRMYRILSPVTNRTVIVPLDHGGYGMIEGLEDISNVVKGVVKGGANALILQPGIVKQVYKEIAGKTGLIIRVSAISVFNKNRGLIEASTYSVEDSLMLGADAVITSLYIGGEYEIESIENTSSVCGVADRYGVPCLVEAFPSLDRFKSVQDPEGIIQVIRMAVELGADMVKAYLPADYDFMKEAVKKARVPVVLAGGEASSPIDVLRLAKLAIDAGLAGVCFGRKVFKYKDPSLMVKALSLIIHEGLGVEEASKILV